MSRPFFLIVWRVSFMIIYVHPPRPPADPHLCPSIYIFFLLIAGHLWQLQTTNHQLFFLNSNYLQYNGNLKKYFLSIAVQLMTIAVSPQNRPPADLRSPPHFPCEDNQQSIISHQSSVISPLRSLMKVAVHRHCLGWKPIL